MSPTAMTEVIAVIKSEAAQLGDFCAALAPDAWATPSACADWTVGDVFAHLTQGAHTWDASLRRALQGDAQPPAGEHSLRPGERGSEATAQRAITFRQEMGPEGLLTAFTAGYAQFHQALLTVQAGDWERPCYHRRGNMTISHYTILRLQELLIHGWDIRSAFDPTATLSPASVPLLAPCVERWLRHAFRPTPALTGPLRYHFETAESALLPHDIVVSPEGLQLTSESTARPDIILHCTAGDALLLIYGRLSFDRAVAQGWLDIVGEPAQAQLFPTLFQGF
ncbi:MAG: maleylpyruvate isomerase family mycothiol-dependent enzyme [Candidatus Tectimicrobiota bacterium]